MNFRIRQVLTPGVVFFEDCPVSKKSFVFTQYRQFYRIRDKQTDISAIFINIANNGRVYGGIIRSG